MTKFNLISSILHGRKCNRRIFHALTFAISPFVLFRLGSIVFMANLAVEGLLIICKSGIAAFSMFSLLAADSSLKSP